MPHIELDSLYFGPDFSRAPLPLLRERTRAAIAGDHWVTDGNKRAVRDFVWPRADTIIWLDYPLSVSLWRLARRARTRTLALGAQAAQTGRRARAPQADAGGRDGVLTALRSHRGQRRQYPRMFAQPANQHLAVARLRSPRATASVDGSRHRGSARRRRALSSGAENARCTCAFASQESGLEIHPSGD